jgi:WD40 repeat protein
MRHLGMGVVGSLLVLACAIGLDGKVLVRADTPPTEKTEEPSTLEPPEKVSLALDTGGHTAEVVHLAFTPDDHELMSASRDGTIRFWDVETGETEQVLRPPLTGLHRAALSADGKTLAVAGREGTDWVILLISRHEERVRRLLEHANRVDALAFSPDGKWLISAGHQRDLEGKLAPGNENYMRLWDVERGDLVHSWKEPISAALAAAFAPSGKLFATGGHPHDDIVWSFSDKKKYQTIEGHSTRVRGVAWRPDGEQVATAGDDGVRLWNLKEKKSTLVSNQNSFHVGFSRNGKKLLYLGWASDTEHPARVRDLTTGKDQLFSEHRKQLTAGAISHDGDLAATAGGGGHEIYLWKTATPMQGYRRITGRGAVRYGIGWSPDGKAIAWGNQDLGREQNFQAKMPLQYFLSLEKLTNFGSLLKPAPGTFKAADCPRAQLSRDGFTVELHDNHRGIDVKRSGGMVTTRKFSTEVLCATLLPAGRVVVGFWGGMGAFDAKTGDNICGFRGIQSGTLALACSRDGRYLVSSGLDQVLRVWDVEQIAPAKPAKVVHPLLSLFVAGGGAWIAWTPQGYYAASPNGEQLMGWQLDNGPDRLASFFPAEQFHKSLHRPDIIKALLAKGSVEKVVWEIDKERKPLQVADVLPPTVNISEPAQGAILDKPELIVKATAEGGTAPVSGLQLILDGRPYPDAQAQLTGLKTAQAAGEWKVKVPPGRHRFSVLAQTDKSSGYASAVTVTSTAEPSLPRLFFLAIGINAYQNVGKLECAVNDATTLEEAIRKQKDKKDLFSDVKTMVLTDTKATPLAVVKGLEWLQEAESDDVVVIFYAGHGERDDKGDFQLLTATYDPQRAAGTTVSGKELKAKLAGLRSRRVLLLLDACHSGAIGTDALAGELKQPDCGVAVLCAARGDESSLEKSGHGFFTKWLLDGLKGEAGTNAKGEITLARLYVHVEEKVPTDTDDRQHPVLVGLAAIRSFALAKP